MTRRFFFAIKTVRNQVNANFLVFSLTSVETNKSKCPQSYQLFLSRWLVKSVITLFSIQYKHKEKLNLRRKIKLFPKCLLSFSSTGKIQPPVDSLWYWSLCLYDFYIIFQLIDDILFRCEKKTIIAWWRQKKKSFERSKKCIKGKKNSTSTSFIFTVSRSPSFVVTRDVKTTSSFSFLYHVPLMTLAKKNYASEK